jgi:hypothetical protein
MLKLLRGKASDRKLRLFAVACCRRAWGLLEASCLAAVDVAERFADGNATAEQMRVAQQVAYDESKQMFPNLDSALLSEDIIRLSLFPLSYRPDDRDWKRHADANWVRGENPELLRAESVAYRAMWAAQGAASDRTWGAFHSHGRHLCTAYACDDVAQAMAGLPTEDAAAWFASLHAQHKAHAVLLRDIFDNPFLPRAFPRFWSLWNDGLLPALAGAIYQERAFDRLPVLADALEDAGCADADLLGHLRGPGPHVRGCWALDLVLGKA